MANSEGVMTRLAKLETNVATMTSDIGELKLAAWRTTEILVDHSEHLSRLQQATDGLQRSMEGMQRSMDGVNDRLDRLIAVTIQERTASTERLGEIEKRLARLEERVGI